MPLRRFRRPIASLSVAAISACSGGIDTTAPIGQTPVDTMPPPIQREMRGLWIATVANIDWPSRTGLTAAQQQAELADILDRATAAGLNAVMFHIRPAADGVYSSSIEPWASMLTGTQGKDPGYDPLAFAVTEAHARGLEIHAWINGRHVWPGLATCRVADGTASAFTTAEIPNQIALTRTRPAGTGHMLYNTSTTLKKSGGAVAASLSALYATPALVPASPWLDSTPPPTPLVSVSGRTVQMTPGAGEEPRWWVVRSRTSGTWSTRVLFGDLRTLTLGQDADRALLTAVDQAGNVSSAATWQKP